MRPVIVLKPAVSRIAHSNSWRVHIYMFDTYVYMYVWLNRFIVLANKLLKFNNSNLFSS